MPKTPGCGFESGTHPYLRVLLPLGHIYSTCYQIDTETTRLKGICVIRDNTLEFVRERFILLYRNKKHVYYP